MEIVYLSKDIITQKEMDRLGIKCISIISETDPDVLHPRLIVKYKDGIKKYVHIVKHIITEDEFRGFLEDVIPGLKED